MADASFQSNTRFAHGSFVEIEGCRTVFELTQSPVLMVIELADCLGYNAKSLSAPKKITVEIAPGANRTKREKGQTLSDDWVSARLIAEPQITSFEGSFREFSAVLITYHVEEDNYSRLEEMDKNLLNEIRKTGRYMQSSRVTDFIGDNARSIERERTVFIR